jgi:hypothetical protein
MIAAMAQSATAAKIPVCPPHWMAATLQSMGIRFQCSIDGGGPVDESARAGSTIVPLPVKSRPVEPPSRIIPLPIESVPVEPPSVPVPTDSRVVPDDNEGSVTFRERWTDPRG